MGFTWAGRLESMSEQKTNSGIEEGLSSAFIFRLIIALVYAILFISFALAR